MTSAAIPPVEVTPAVTNATFARHNGHIVLLLISNHLPCQNAATKMMLKPVHPSRERCIAGDGCGGSDKCGGIREPHFTRARQDPRPCPGRPELGFTSAAAEPARWNSVQTEHEPCATSVGPVLLQSSGYDLISMASSFSVSSTAVRCARTNATLSAAAPGGTVFSTPESRNPRARRAATSVSAHFV